MHQRRHVNCVRDSHLCMIAGLLAATGFGAVDAAQAQIVALVQEDAGVKHTCTRRCPTPSCPPLGPRSLLSIGFVPFFS